jgi:N,N'-diacetyllegionaminate synthase
MIIAEIGSVHDGSYGNALKLIELAKECGADFVKFQTHIAEAETLENAPSPSYFSEESRYEYFSRTSFSLFEWSSLKKHADNIGIQFLSSPFSLQAVDLLEEIGVTGYKIPSGEITNIPLLEKIANCGKPVYLSSGMSNWLELDRAVSVFIKKCDLTIMQCSSKYPCNNKSVGLNVVKEMSDRYGIPVGFSDHTLGMAASISAVALGAKVIEKHLTFSKLMYGSDAKHSMEPTEFKYLSSELKSAMEMIDNPIDKDDVSEYQEMKNIFQKSIVATVSIQLGTVISLSHLAFKKPGTGIPASEYKTLIGKKLIVNCDKDDIILKEWLA